MMYQLIFAVVLLIIAYFIGSRIEKKHYVSIIAREKRLNKLPVIAIKTPPSHGHFKQQLVMGNVTISVDYFKRFLAALHNFFGGRVTSYETLLDRARREAILRMKESAEEMHASLILNVKYETASIYKGSGSSIGSVEVLAYGTAMIPDSSKNDG